MMLTTRVFTNGTRLALVDFIAGTRQRRGGGSSDPWHAHS